MSIFAEWQRLREVKVLVLYCGGLFNDYDLHVAPLSADIAGMDALLLNYWFTVVKIHDGSSCFSTKKPTEENVS